MFSIIGAIWTVITRGHDEFAATGKYSEGGLYWRDQLSGRLYHVHATETERCEVRGAERGVDWKRSTLSRPAGHPAIVRCRFDAVADGAGQVAGSVSFSRHARRGIQHVDDLGPRTAEPQTSDRTGLRVWPGDRESAAAALEKLDRLLRARGWEDDGPSGRHWYSRRYQRPVILWDQPVQAGEIPAFPSP